MTTRSTEILVGAFVAAGFAALFMLAMKVSNLSSMGNNEGYTLAAHFENIGGLKVRSPVTVAGVRVGRVSAISYDKDRYKARVSMSIDAIHDYFSIDTAASIYTAGLLGEQYVALEPGAEDELLKAGDVIEHTQSAMVLEEIIGNVLVKLTTK